MDDNPAREKALETTQSFIVQAPAGSGKTELLTSRFVCLLASESIEQPEEILAVTFTRKATAEMRERILDVLNPETDTELHQQSAISATKRVQDRSEELGWNLHQQPSRLRIMTFDALATELIRRMPWSSRFGSVPGVAEQPEKVYRAAVVHALEHVSERNEELRDALRVLHKHLDNSSERLLGLIVEMLANRDQWPSQFFQAEFSDGDRSKMEKVWRKFNKFELDKLADRFPQTVREILDLEGRDNFSDHALEHWRAVAAALLTKTGTWRKRYASIECGAVNLDTNTFKFVIKECCDIPMLDKSLLSMGMLAPNPVFSDEQWAVLRAASIMLQYSVAHLKMEFSRRGEVDFIENAQSALTALGDPSNPTDLTLVLDYQISHILVDEFQDSSYSQKKLLESLTAGWQDRDGRTLFLVGDPMQSIYRFRQAEVGVYLDVAEHGLKNIRLTQLSLNQNYRSAKNMVDWFNDVFKLASPKESDIMGSRVAYSPCQSDNPSKSDTPVRVWLQDTKDRSGETLDRTTRNSREAHKVYNDIRDYLDRNDGSDMRVAVLVSSRKHVYELIPLLEEGGIPYHAPEMFPLAERPVVRDILSLTRALLNPTDRVAWLAVLRAPWCGLTLDDLFVVANCRYTLIWDRLNQSEVIDELSAEGCQRILRTRKVLAHAFSIRGRLGVRQWVEDTWVLLGGPACVGVGDDENARLFLDLLENFAKGAEVDGLEQFEDQMQRLYAAPICSQEEADVQIMTIHGSKGLEFDAVFIPSLDKRTGNPPSPLIIWSQILLKDSGSGTLMSAIPDTASETGDLMYPFLKKWNRDKDLMELTRLVYVGCTRAKSELHLYAAINIDKKPDLGGRMTAPGETTLLGRLWPGLEDGRSEVIQDFELPAILKKELGKSTSPIISRLPSDWKLPPPPQALEIPDQDFESPGDYDSIDFDWAGSVAVWTGIIVHQWLYRIVQSGSENWNAERVRAERPKWKTALCALGLSSDSDGFDDAIRRIETALVNVLNDATGRWLLDSSHEDTRAEYRLTGYVNGIFRNVILDRTFIDQDGTRWIVDYKTGTTDGDIDDFLDNEVQRYRNQLIEYKTIMSGFENRPIRLGLYFPLFARWRGVE